MAAHSTTACKICGSTSLEVFQHTATCNNCGVLLYFPYPDDVSLEINADEEKKQNAYWRTWYQRAARLNHLNFTRMFLFAIPDPEAIYTAPVSILDYGAGGGQFALICKSFLPISKVYATDISDFGLLDEYREMNTQVRWNAFVHDETQFDYIFLNDVFEHVNHPVDTLQLLSGKLKPGGKLFIDTPKQFWLYPLLKYTFGKLYTKLLKGTVSKAHLQIWTKRSFMLAVDQSGLSVEKYKELNEFTLRADHYLKTKMGISNRFVLFAGNVFYTYAKRIAKNKIMCVLAKK